MVGSTELAAYRILDAAANRSSEGLRTMEEFARFVLEDRFLSECAKSIRHDLRNAIGAISLDDRLKARSVTSDCGTTIEVASEMHRDDAASVAAAAAARVQESVRCIEEYGKTVRGFDSQQVEAIRYRIYTLAAALLLMSSRIDRLRVAKLYLLMPTNDDLEQFSTQVEDFFSSGIDILQLRDKRATDRQLYACARVASDVARRLGKIFIVNDRADIAAATHASGVHVGQDELPVEAARRIVGATSIVGVSTHNLDQAKKAVLDGADYIGCGPTFPSPTKQFDSYPGLPFVRQITEEIRLPAYAIGGIDKANLANTLATGIHGIALTSAIHDSGNPNEATLWFRKMLLDATGSAAS